MGRLTLLLPPLLGLATGAIAQDLIVTEVMYDPIADENRWEWFEVYNQGDVAVDLDGYVMDRVGDPEQAIVTPSILASENNPTVIPAGGVAILYNGPGLGYDPDRFRSAWPKTPVGTTLIGVEGWSSNRLTNSPEPSDYAPELPALTVGLWPNAASYLHDTEDFSQSGVPDERVARVDNAAITFGYDDSEPWADTEGTKTLIYIGGPVLESTSWLRTNYPYGGASISVATTINESINQPEIGSPGRIPAGAPDNQGLIITEMMVNAASITGGQEWEWIEVLNTGAAIDFAETPLWLDDDDEGLLTEPNVTAGSLPSGETAVLFNAEAVTHEQIAAAWQQSGAEPINWIGVEEWPALANAGDLVGLWDSAGDYANDRLAETPSVDHAVAGLIYDDSDPWPPGADGEAIRLVTFQADPADPAAWAAADGETPDPQAYQSNEVDEPTGVLDHLGGEEASPGFVWPDIVSPLPGDYNNDGAVNAADYTLWRDGLPLPTETTSVGEQLADDYEVWSAHYGLHADSIGAVSTPEPATLTSILLAAGLLSWRPARGDAR